MEQVDQFEVINAQVRRIFAIEDVSLGSATGRDAYVVRYHGHMLTEDTAAAYDQLSAGLKSLGLTPLFRWDDNRQMIVVVPGLPAPRPSNPAVNLVLAILTFFSVLLTGALYTTGGALPSNYFQAAVAIVVNGWPFALAMLGILGAHEFGHYLMGRHHGVHVTLPYFIPLPFSQFGTMGAFINMKELPKNRRVLMDIGIAGPLAGLVVAIPVLLLGLTLSPLNRLPQAIEGVSGVALEGNSLLYLGLKYLVFGKLLPEPASYGGIEPVLYWLQYIFTGQPMPFGGMDVTLHPVAWAGWAGLLVTALNLIPAGQLDGGHLLYVLVGRKIANRTLPLILIGLVLLGFVWNGWWLWAGLIFLLGRAHAEPLDQITTLDQPRRLLALLGLIVFILTFTPVPLVLFG